MQALIHDLEFVSLELNSIAVAGSSLSAIPVNSLVSELELTFGENLCASYSELSANQKKIYEEVGLLLDELLALWNEVRKRSDATDNQVVIA